MSDDIKTVGDAQIDPLNSVKKESIHRMKAALLAASMDDPYSIASSLRQVTILRVQHQITRIVQYLDLMDRLEEKMYESIDLDLATLDTMDTRTVTKLLSIQANLQKAIIESNKLLQPFLEMDKYPAFDVIETEAEVNPELLELPTAKRDLLRENAGAILEELNSLSSVDEVEAEVVMVDSYD